MGDASNYTVTYVPANFVITPVQIAVTADPQTKVYDGLTSTDPALTYTYTGTLVGTDKFTGALTRTPGEAVGTYPISQGTLALTSNYSIAFSGANFVITPASANVLVLPYSVTYDGNSHTATGTATGVGNADLTPT